MVLISGRGGEEADKWTDLSTSQEGDPTGTEVEIGVRNRGRTRKTHPQWSGWKTGGSSVLIGLSGWFRW